jgi:hypothetical protein
LTFLGLCVALIPSFADAELPLPIYPDCGETHLSEDCPSDLGGRWNYVSYVDPAYVSVREEEWDLGSGMAVDRAWGITTGSTEVLIAVLDSGIQWDNGDTRRKHHLNRGELLEPQDGDGVSEAGVWDLDGDGVFTIDDYASDPRVDPADGVDVADHHLDPSDLIHNEVFSNGEDDDGNGYVDDISGWDFHWNDNDPYDDTRYGHGTYEAETSSAEGNDGGDIGVCPNCMILNVRTGDAFIMDGDNYASGVIFAADSGAHVVQAASGTLGHSGYAREAMAYAYGRGVTLVCASADETSFHQNYPSTDPYALSVKAVRYDDDETDEITTFLNYSNCTNFGPRVDLSAPSTGCASGGTAMSAGAAGLVISAGVEAGLDPPLSPGEVIQVLVSTADDIDVEESRGDDADEEKYPSYPGYDLFFSHGRINVGRAVEAVVGGQIPPSVFVESPAWFEPVYAHVADSVAVHGTIESRNGDLTVTVSWAGGGDPREEDFVEVATLTAADGVDGELATLAVADLLAGSREAPRQLSEDDDNVDRAMMAHGWMVHVRVVAQDGDGNVGVGRRTFSLMEDPDVCDGFPVDLGASAEGSPNLVDLDGDGAVDIIIGTSDGRVHAVDGTGRALPGWPVTVGLLDEVDPDGEAHHLDSAAFVAGEVSSGAWGAVSAPPQWTISTGTARPKWWSAPCAASSTCSTATVCPCPASRWEWTRRTPFRRPPPQRAWWTGASAPRRRWGTWTAIWISRSWSAGWTASSTCGTTTAHPSTAGRSLWRGRGRTSGRRRGSWALRPSATSTATTSWTWWSAPTRPSAPTTAWPMPCTGRETSTPTARTWRAGPWPCSARSPRPSPWSGRVRRPRRPWWTWTRTACPRWSFRPSPIPASS